MRRLTAVRSADDGTSLAEFALVTPLLFLVLMGIIEMGRWAAFDITVANAARAGATYGAQSATTPGDASDIESAVCSDAQNTNCPDPTASATNALTVTAPYGTSSSPQFYYCTTASGVGATPDPNASPDSTCASPAPDVQRNMWVKVTVTGTFTPLFNFPGLPSQLPVSSTAIVQVAQ